MKILFYLPSGLSSPELEVMLSIIQKKLDNKKNNVSILTSGGGNSYHCNKNLYALKSIYYLSEKNLYRGINQLKGKYETIKIPALNSKHKKAINFQNNKWHTYTYKRIYDNGLAAYSSYVTSTRDRDLDGFFSLKIMRNLVSTSNHLSDFFESFLKRKNFNSVFLFNGRMNIYRPLLRASQKLRIKSINVIEFNGNNDQIFNYGDKLPGNKKYLASQMKLNWNKNKRKRKMVSNFVSKKEVRQTLMNKNQFKVIQDKDLLPENWNENFKNVVYFVSSDDEQLTNGDFLFRPFKNQLESIKFTCNILKGKKFKNFKFWVRMHPRLTGLNWPYLKKIIQLKKKYSNINLIYPKEKISSYAMLRKAHVVVSPVSSLTIDGAFFKKRTINFMNSSFSILGGTMIPKSKKNYLRLLLSQNSNLFEKNKILAEKYYLYYLTGGSKNNYLSGNMINGFKFNKNKRIMLNIYEKFLYTLSKFFEKIVCHYCFNYLFSKIFKVNNNSKFKI